MGERTMHVLESIGILLFISLLTTGLSWVLGVNYNYPWWMGPLVLIELVSLIIILALLWFLIMKRERTLN